MASIELADLKAHLNITTDTDDALLTEKIAVAEDWIESFIGVEFADFGDGVPRSVKEAVRQLAAHLYENREASLVGASAQELPFGLIDLLTPHREWAF
jgi:uncharacterized phage protein (predicted DNA packaging)